MRDQLLWIHFEAGLVEESVFLAMRRLGEEDPHGRAVRAFHKERDEIYNVPDTRQREARFRDFSEREFSELGLRDFFETIYREFPLLVAESLTAWVRRVLDRKQEGSELYVEGARRMVIVKMRAARFLDLNDLGKFLRHELMHISDMLDPQFQYSPNTPLGGKNELEDNLIRERFRLVWDLYVSSRIEEAGREPFAPVKFLEPSLHKAFCRWSLDERGDIFRDVRKKRCWTQTELLKLCRGRSLDTPSGLQSEARSAS